MLVVVCGSRIARRQGFSKGRVVRSAGRRVPPKPSNRLISTIRTPGTELGCPLCFGAWTHAEAGWSHKIGALKSALLRAYLCRCPGSNISMLALLMQPYFLGLTEISSLCLICSWLFPDGVGIQYCLKEKFNLFSMQKAARLAAEFRNRLRCLRETGSRSTVRYRRFQPT